MWNQHRATRRAAIAPASAVALWRLVGPPADALAAQSPGALIDFLHFVEQVQIDESGTEVKPAEGVSPLNPAGDGKAQCPPVSIAMAALNSTSVATSAMVAALT